MSEYKENPNCGELVIRGCLSRWDGKTMPEGEMADLFLKAIGAEGLSYGGHLQGFDEKNPMPMTGNEYQKEALRTASMTDSESLLLNGVLGLAGEGGECCDMVKKHLFQGHPLDKAHMAKELGDVAWYLAIAAAGIGYGLDDIFQMNVDKLMARYPNGFEAERSLNRKAGDV